MPSPRPANLLQRSALALWFCGLSALGLLRFFMRVSRDPNAWTDTVMQVWLIGSLLLGAIGAWLSWRAFAAHRRERRH
ncbi:hypothetical protein [Lysobacter panacisoli]|uniref:DUF202 domain-containing protein n=1 Tax=Lysobacter panacisoli TaxID=1255263 RepID=A0ABP9LFM0_9GAMM|nr:hypothetical protein [Lysobacter panacisoli]